jgi:hypothetical protein
MTELYQTNEHMSRLNLVFFCFYVRIVKILLKQREYMAREKLQRELTLKLKSKYFGPKDAPPQEDIVLLHEEVEAIQLMDLENMYQEDAAKKDERIAPYFCPYC